MLYQVKMHRAYMGVYIRSWEICQWEFLRTFEKCKKKKAGGGKGGSRPVTSDSFYPHPFLSSCHIFVIFLVQSITQFFFALCSFHVDYFIFIILHNISVSQFPLVPFTLAI